MVRDHVDLISSFEVEERKIQEEIESVRVENAQIRDQVREITRTTSLRKLEAKEEYEKNAEEYQGKFREQTKI